MLEWYDGPRCCFKGKQVTACSEVDALETERQSGLPSVLHVPVDMLVSGRGKVQHDSRA